MYPFAYRNLGLNIDPRTDVLVFLDVNSLIYFKSSLIPTILIHYRVNCIALWKFATVYSVF